MFIAGGVYRNKHMLDMDIEVVSVISTIYGYTELIIRWIFRSSGKWNGCTDDITIHKDKYRNWTRLK